MNHRLIVGAAIAFGLTEILISQAPSYLVFALLTPLLGVTALTMITAANTFVQLHTEAGMRGRVMALYLMIFVGGTPVGSPLIGYLGEVYGARATLWVGGALTVLGTALASGAFLWARSRSRAVLTAVERPSNVNPRVWVNQTVACAQNSPADQVLSAARSTPAPSDTSHHDRARQSAGF